MPFRDSSYGEMAARQQREELVDRFFNIDL
jgi:hypothetical protein